MDTSPAEYSPRTTFLESDPNFIVLDLELARGISMPDEHGELIVKLSVKNSSQYNAEKIVLADTLPDDFRYKWDSASVNNPSDLGYKVSAGGGINPYRFTVGKLEKDKELVLTYRGLSTKKEVKAKKEETAKPTESRLAVDFKWLGTDPTDGSKGAQHE